MTRRLNEMTLVLAGQEQWRQGAELLERVIPRAEQLTEAERLALRNIVKGYRIKLEKIGQSAQAARLEAAQLETDPEKSGP